MQTAGRACKFILCRRSANTLNCSDEVSDQFSLISSLRPYVSQQDQTDCWLSLENYANYGQTELSYTT